MINKSIHESQGLMGQKIIKGFGEIKHVSNTFRNPEKNAEDNRNENYFKENICRF